MPDPLDAWRDAFGAIPETTGQTRLYLGPNELEQEATREQIEQQVTSAADEKERGER